MANSYGFQAYRLQARRVFWIVLLITSICYLPSLNIPFHFDDSHSIQNNLAIRSMRNFSSFWTDPTTSSLIPENRTYRPLTYTIYSICWALGGGDSWPFHVFKVIAHAFVAWMIFWLWRRLWSEEGWFPIPVRQYVLGGRTLIFDSESIALLLAVAFAIHPACVEVGAYVSASTSLFCSVFYLASYCFFWRSWDHLKKVGKNSSYHWFLSSALFFYFLSFFSKEEGVTLPVVICLTVLFVEQGGFIQRLKTSLRLSLPFWGACAIFLAIYKWKMPIAGFRSHGTLSSLEYFFTQWRAYLWYMKLWFWPWGLNADNVVFGFSHSFVDPLVLQAFILNLCLLFFGVFTRKRFPSFLFGLLWFYITILPASSLFPLAEPINEHRMYLSYVGWAGGTVCFLVWFGSVALQSSLSFRGALVCISLVYLGLFVGTENRLQVWRTSEALWADTVEKNPNSGRALNNLALIYMARAEYPRALDLLGKCEVAWSAYSYCSINKGITYMALKDAPNAEASLKRAITLDPENTFANFNMGRLYDEFKHDPDHAIFYYTRANFLTANRFSEAKVKLARIYLAQGKREPASLLVNDVLMSEPGNIAAQDILRELKK